ncbi:MAG: hypothetical protein L3J88_01345 [Gammaproteobacteria bacterium]|nr:hypothetical protein [Gammaproteobacteria bacterium]MCF6362012.1 hypothetical protein [Gammaproteobacteria bacterium]
MKQQSWITLAVLVATTQLILPGTVFATDYRPAMLATPCAGCHGPDGDSPGSIPSLTGLSTDDIISSMKAFKTDQRKGTVMNRIAKGYSDEEIDLMASYFSRKP